MMLYYTVRIFVPLLSLCGTTLSFGVHSSVMHKKRGGLAISNPSSPPSCCCSAGLAATAGDDDQADAEQTREKKAGDEIKPDILIPFPPAADPMFMCRGPVGEKNFILQRTGEPTKEELANENILKIVRIECSDLEVNTLVWKCLGYRFDAEQEEWNNEQVFPNFRKKYPIPPDFIGMQRIYEKEIDQPSLRANQALVRSVPMHAKQSLKTHLKPLGFRGYQYKELTPNKTRRAQCANWLIYYREELFGYSLEELQERKKKRQEEDAAKREDGEWTAPVKEVF